MSQELTHQAEISAIEKTIIQGDLSGLSPEQRLNYYRQVCESLKLNWLTKPFEFLELKDKAGTKKVVLYTRKDCTEQLRKRDGISIEIISREVVEDVYVVCARAFTIDDRCDESLGAVSLKGISAEERANAIMKAETKAKRRVTLSICGLGFLDESEIDSIPDAKVIESEVR